MRAHPPGADPGPDLFDEHAARYEQILAETVAGTGFPPGHFQAYKVVETARALRGRKPARLLDFGCGIGLSVPYLKRAFPEAELFASDRSEASLALARRRCEGFANITFGLQAGPELPFPGPFDLIFAANVFHHIPPPERPGVLALLKGALSGAGALFVFEHNPWNPLTARAVRRCPLDRDAVLLSPRETRRLAKAAGFRTTRIRFHVFLPGWLSSLLPLERALAWLPLGAQYSARLTD